MYVYIRLIHIHTLNPKHNLEVVVGADGLPILVEFAQRVVHIRTLHMCMYIVYAVHYICACINIAYASKLPSELFIYVHSICACIYIQCTPYTIYVYAYI